MSTDRQLRKMGLASGRLLPIGYGGVLYPSKGLFANITEEVLFLKLTPQAGDLWFEAMSHLKRRKVRKGTIRCEKPIPIMGVNGGSLANSNIKQGGNRRQWLTICDCYKMEPDSLMIESTHHSADVTNVTESDKSFDANALLSKTIMKVDPRHFRPAEVETLLGDPSKAKAQLGWTPKIKFEELVAEMVDHDLDLAKRHALLKKEGFSVELSKE